MHDIVESKVEGTRSSLFSYIFSPDSKYSYTPDFQILFPAEGGEGEDASINCKLMPIMLCRWNCP